MKTAHIFQPFFASAKIFRTKFLMKRKGDYITLSKNAKRLMIENENENLTKYDVEVKFRSM